MIVLVLFGAAAILASPGRCQAKTNESCPEHQVWIDCERGYCVPKSCDQLGYRIRCPHIAGPCPGGCICIEGYLKNSQGVCIPQEQCPSCGGDHNATIGGGHHCGNLCSNYFEDQSKFEACRKEAGLYNACECHDGYVFNEITGHCVEPSDCPKPCNGDYHAEPHSCPSSCQPTCAHPSFDVCTNDCNKNECVCVTGYILDQLGGKCIKIEDCPGNLGCNDDPNAIITSCASKCPLTCEQINHEREPVYCTTLCDPLGCSCKAHYVWSEKKGRCILESECITGESGSKGKWH